MTREEAISLLTQVNHILVNSNSWLENTHEPLNIAFNMAIKALEQEPRWIPVSERLPTKEEYIANNGLFIVSDGNRTYVECFVIYKSIKCFCTMNGFREDRCITAWMPLPKPYEPQESEDKK